MSFGPNMHYCRFENTFDALKQIAEDLVNPPEDLLETEKDYRERILAFMSAVNDRINLEELDNCYTGDVEQYFD